MENIPPQIGSNVKNPLKQTASSKRMQTSGNDEQKK
jgi:hypothetical protein